MFHPDRYMGRPFGSRKDDSDAPPLVSLKTAFRTKGQRGSGRGMGRPGTHLGEAETPAVEVGGVLKPSDLENPHKRAFLTQLSDRIFKVALDPTEVERKISLERLFTPATDSPDLTPTRNKKVFSSSAFYRPDHPTIGDQVDLAKRISASLFNDDNKQSRGQTMYIKRKKRSVRWIHQEEGIEYEEDDDEGPGGPGLVEVSEPDSPQRTPGDRGPMKLMMSSKQEKVDQAYHTSEMDSPTGKGAALFAKRKKRMDKYVVDENTVQQSMEASSFAQQQTSVMSSSSMQSSSITQGQQMMGNTVMNTSVKQSWEKESVAKGNTNLMQMKQPTENGVPQITNLPQLYPVTIDRPVAGNTSTDMTPLANLVKLRSIPAKNTGHEHSDAAEETPFTNLVQLRPIVIKNPPHNEPSNETPLANLIKLKPVTTNTPSTQISQSPTPLTNLVQLKPVVVKEPSQSTSLVSQSPTPLANMVQLKPVTVKDPSQSTSLISQSPTPLANMVQLKPVAVKEPPQNTSLISQSPTPLANIVQLKPVVVKGPPQSTTLNSQSPTPLVNIVQLKPVVVKDPPQSTSLISQSPTPLTNLVQLKPVVVKEPPQSTALNSESPTPLTNMVQLKPVAVKKQTQNTTLYSQSPTTLTNMVQPKQVAVKETPQSTTLSPVGGAYAGPTNITYGAPGVAAGPNNLPDLTSILVQPSKSQPSACKPTQSHKPQTGAGFSANPTRISTGYTNKTNQGQIKTTKPVPKSLAEIIKQAPVVSVTPKGVQSKPITQSTVPCKSDTGISKIQESPTLPPAASRQQTSSTDGGDVIYTAECKVVQRSHPPTPQFELPASGRLEMTAEEKHEKRKSFNLAAKGFGTYQNFYTPVHLGKAC